MRGRQNTITVRLLGTMSLVLCFFSTGWTQQNLPRDPDFELLEKYWSLREHQHEKWVRGGNCEAGFGHIGTRWKKDAGGSGKPMMGTGDGSAHQGGYLGMLAVEYDQLSRNQQPVDSTIQELYYALNNIFRLDLTSGDYDYDSHNWPACTIPSRNGPPPCLDGNYTSAGLNGFLIRGDAPPRFYSPLGIDSCQSDLHTLQANNCANKEESYDQAIQVMHGLMMVEKLCGNINYQGINFAAYAKFEAHLMVEHIRAGGWWIRNPHKVNNDYVSRGPDARWYAFPLSKLIKQLTGNTYSDALSLSSKGFWQTMQHTPYAPGQSINEQLFLTTAAISNAWYFCPPPLGPRLGLACYLTNSILNTTPEGIERWGLRNRKELYYLTHNILHPNTHQASHLDANYYQNLLNLAPCDSIRSPWPNLSTTPGWTNSNKFFVPRIDCADRDRNGKCLEFIDVMKYGKAKTDDESYSGVDYCILYGAFSKVYGDTPDFYNLMDTWVFKPFPRTLSSSLPIPLKGSQLNPSTIRSLDRISIESKLDAQLTNGNPNPLLSAELTLIARNEILLAPGFTLAPGANFTAVITGDPIPCIGSEVKKMEEKGESIAYLDSVWAYTDSTFDQFQETLTQTLGKEIDSLRNFTERNPAGTRSKTESFSTTSVSGIHLYPNPARDRLTLEFNPQEIIPEEIQIWDNQSHLIQHQKFPLGGDPLDGHWDLDLTQFPSGLYLMRIISAQKVLSYKFMVQK